MENLTQEQKAEYVKKGKAIVVGTFLVLLILVIIIIATMIYAANCRSCHRKMVNDMLTGFWQCDADFCKEADLSSFVLLIDKFECPFFGDSSITGYVDIRSDAKHGVNKAFIFTINKCKTGKKDKKTGHSLIKIKGCFSEEITGLPKMANLVYNVHTGYLSLIGRPDNIGEKTLYARLVKDSTSTLSGLTLAESI